jgi:hypothetical protein
VANPPGDTSTACNLRTWAPPVGILLLFLLVGGCGAFFSLFSEFRFTDDEGYLLISLRQFIGGHPLYDEVFTQYGPLHYLTHGLLFKTTGTAVGHDSMRLLVLAQAVGIALLVAAVFFRLTANRWLSVLVFPVALQAVHPLFAEPGHPQSLALLLFFGLVLTASWREAAPSGRTAALMGAWVGSLLMTKFNVGLFALVALVWTLAVFSRRGPAIAVGLAILALPWLLMRTHLGAEGNLEFALTISISFLAVALFCLRGESPEPRVGLRPWLAAAAGCAVAVAVISAVTLMTGTSLAGLARGVAWRPGKTLFLLPANFDIKSVVWSAVSLACVLRVGVRPPTPGTFSFGLVLALKVGLALVTASHQWPTLLERALPFVWVGLVPVPGRRSYGRVLLVSLTVIHALVAYPLSGTQKAVSIVPLVLIGALCLHDAWRMWAGLRAKEWSGLQRAAAGGLLAAALLIHQGILAANAFRRHQEGVRLDLPGARLLRPPGADGERLRRIVRELGPYETIVTVPGMNSLYLLAQKEPPTSLNCTAWMFLLSDAEQERIIAAVASAPSACVVYHRGLQAFWGSGRRFDDAPLMRFLKKEFRLLKAVDDYEIHERLR